MRTTLLSTLGLLLLAGSAEAQLDRVFTDEQRDAILDCVDEAQDRDLEIERLTSFRSDRDEVDLEMIVSDRSGDEADIGCRWDGRAELEEIGGTSDGFGTSDPVDEAVDVCTEAAEDEGLRVVDILATDEDEDHISVDLRVRVGGDGTNYNCTFDGERVRLREKE